MTSQQKIETCLSDVLLLPIAKMIIEYIQNPAVIAIKLDGTKLFDLKNEKDWNLFRSSTNPYLFGNLFDSQSTNFDSLNEWCFHWKGDKLKNSEIRAFHKNRTLSQRCGWHSLEAESQVKDLWEERR